MMVSAEVVITPNGLNALLALMGALFGVLISAIGARQVLVARRASRLQVEVEDSLDELRLRGNAPDAVRETLYQQRDAVERARVAMNRREVFYRLVAGYLMLITIAAGAVTILIRSQDGVSAEIPYGWFIFGVLVAVALALTLYLLAVMNRIRIHQTPLSIGPISLAPSDEPGALRQVSLANNLLEVTAEWLRGEGYSITRTPLSSGFDLLARRESTLAAVEVKSGERLTLLMIDALVGAAARARILDEGLDRLLLVAPQQTIERTPKAVLNVAADQGIEIFAICSDGSIVPQNHQSAV